MLDQVVVKVVDLGQTAFTESGRIDKAEQCQVREQS